MSRDQPEDLIKLALEASIYVAPADHGLTEAELVEVGGRMGRGPGAIRDALRALMYEFKKQDGRIRIVDGDSLLASFSWELEQNIPTVTRVQDRVTRLL